MHDKSPFLDTIIQLRKEGSLVVYADLHEISAKEEQQAAAYLETEFEKEKLHFFSDGVPFNKEAAVWAAKILYRSAQLYLIRKNTAKEMHQWIPDFRAEKNRSALLSADLLLRYIPQIYDALHVADSEDPLVKLLEGILKSFHYSAIGLDLELENINWNEELKDKTYRKLYLERVVEKKAYQWAEIPAINSMLMAEFGMYKEVFWRELQIINTEPEEPQSGEIKRIG